MPQQQTGALSGQVALVTGASRGIGAATAVALAGAGAHVILVARDAAALEVVEERIHAAGGSATIAPLDLADGDSIARLSVAIGERWPTLDILVLNAAMLGTLTQVVTIDQAEMSRVFGLNVFAQAALLSAFTPALRASASGKVIALTSSVGADPRPFWGAYAASKAALDNLVTTYGAEMANMSNVRTAIIDPGATRTAMRARAYPGEDPATVKEPELVAGVILRLATDGFDSTARIAVAR